MALAELIVKLGVVGRSQVDSALDRTKGKLEQVGRAAGKAGDAMSKLAGAMGIAAGATAVLGGVIGAKAFASATEYDSQVRGLAAYASGAEELAAQLSRLQELAKLPGLGVGEVRQAVLALEAAGLSAQLSEQAVRGFGNALALAGRGKSDLKGVIVQLGQIASKGKLSAEEIGIIAERVPQIRGVLQDAFGTASTDEIQRMGITANDAIQRIIGGLNRLPIATGGVRNTIDNLADAIDAALLPIGIGLTNMFAAIAPAGADLIEYFAQVGQQIGAAFEAIGRSGALQQTLQVLGNAFGGGANSITGGVVHFASVVLGFFQSLPNIVSNSIQLATQYVMTPLANIAATIANMLEVIPFVGSKFAGTAQSMRAFADDLNARQYGALQPVDIMGRAGEIERQILGSLTAPGAGPSLPTDLIFGGNKIPAEQSRQEEVLGAIERNTRETADNTGIDSRRVGGGPLFQLGVTARERQMGPTPAMVGASSVMAGTQIERQIRRIMMDEMRRSGGYGVPRG